MTKHTFGKQWHESQLGTVDEEIARLCYICGIKLLDPGVAERLIKGDETICTKSNPAAFKKLQGLTSMHFMLTRDSIKVLGQQGTEDILAKIRERYRDRFDLGGKA